MILEGGEHREPLKGGEEKQSTGLCTYHISLETGNRRGEEWHEGNGENMDKNRQRYI